MVTISHNRPLIERTRDRPPNMTGLVLCSLMALPFWAIVFAVIF